MYVGCVGEEGSLIRCWDIWEDFEGDFWVFLWVRMVNNSGFFRVSWK